MLDGPEAPLWRRSREVPKLVRNTGLLLVRPRAPHVERTRLGQRGYQMESNCGKMAVEEDEVPFKAMPCHCWLRTSKLKPSVPIRNA
jgi:hypothetical protein